MVGVAGMLLVFASFIVKDWRWLYSLNLAGSLTLLFYAYLRGDPVFVVVEAGIVGMLAYRLYGEVTGRSRSSGACS